jgi:hypothetical protein
VKSDAPVTDKTTADSSGRCDPIPTELSTMGIRRSYLAGVLRTGGNDGRDQNMIYMVTRIGISHKTKKRYPK